MVAIFNCQFDAFSCNYEKDLIISSSSEVEMKYSSNVPFACIIAYHKMSTRSGMQSLQIVDNWINKMEVIFARATRALLHMIDRYLFSKTSFFQVSSNLLSKMAAYSVKSLLLSGHFTRNEALNCAFQFIVVLCFFTENNI